MLFYFDHLQFSKFEEKLPPPYKSDPPPPLTIKYGRVIIVETMIFKGAATDMRNFARSKFSRSLVH